MTLKTIFALSLLGLFSSSAFAANPDRISDAAAKGFIKKALIAKGGNYNWQITLRPGLMPRRVAFDAQHKWQRGDNRLGAPAYHGSIYVAKDSARFTGVNRVLNLD